MDEIATQQLPALVNIFTDDRKINLAKFDEQQRQIITEIASSVKVLDSDTITSFGMQSQRKLNGYLDDLLQGIRTNEVGAAGELTIELARTIKKINIPQMKEEVNGGDWVCNTFGQLPLIGKWASSIRYFQMAHKEIIDHLADIENKAQSDVGKLKAINNKLDQLINYTLENLKELELVLAAGQAIVMRVRAEFSAKKNELSQSNDLIALTQLRDREEQINAFETRLLKIHIAFTDALISVPQIRMTQESSRIAARDIIDTISFDLPRLKRAILQVASLNQIIKASKENEARKELTRQISALGAEALDEAYTKAKRSQGSGAEEVAALAAVVDKLLETINKGVRLDEENKIKRAEAEQQLGTIKVKLMDGMRDNIQKIIQ